MDDRSTVAELLEELKRRKPFVICFIEPDGRETSRVVMHLAHNPNEWSTVRPSQWFDVGADGALVPRSGEHTP